MSNLKKIAIAVLIATGIAKPAEGLYTTAYKDPVGITTICYGSTTNVKMGDRKDLNQCLALLSQEMENAIKEVDKCQPGLPVGVLAAFGDASFNIGSRIACDRANSTAARMLAAGDYVGACHQLPRWNKAVIKGFLVALPGLTKRRNREMEVCLKDLP